MRLTFPLTAAWRSWLERFNTYPPDEGAIVVDQRARYVIPITEVIGGGALPSTVPELDVLVGDPQSYTIQASSDLYNTYLGPVLDVEPVLFGARSLVGLGLLIDQVTAAEAVVICNPTAPPTPGWAAFSRSLPFQTSFAFATWQNAVPYAFSSPTQIAFLTLASNTQPITIGEGDPAIRLEVEMTFGPTVDEINLQASLYSYWRRTSYTR